MYHQSHAAKVHFFIEIVRHFMKEKNAFLVCHLDIISYLFPRTTSSYRFFFCLVLSVL